MKPAIVVFGAALIGAVVSSALWFGVLEKYRSEGTLLLESDLQEYKRLSEVIDNSSTLAEYLILQPSEASVIDAIKKTQGNRSFGKSIADTIYRVSRQDAKEIGEAINFADGGKPVVGLRLSVQAANPETARTAVVWSGEFVRDALLRDSLQAMIRTRASDVRALLPSLDAQLAKEQFEIESAQKRVAALNDVRSRYKEIAERQTPQTLLNIERADPRRLERLLPVPSQLIAAESQIIESNQNISFLQRRRKQAEFELAFFESLEKTAAGQVTGRVLIDGAQKGIDQLHTQYKNDNALAETVADVQKAITDLNQRFKQRVRFISPPSLPDRVSGPGFLATTLGGALLLAALALVVLYRRVLLQLLLGSPGEQSAQAER
jgi:hypothetical protein